MLQQFVPFPFVTEGLMGAQQFQSSLLSVVQHQKQKQRHIVPDTFSIVETACLHFWTVLQKSHCQP